MIVIGIDPGLTGACAILDHNGLRALFDLPTMPIPGVGEKALVKRKVDGRAFCSMLLQHCPVREAVGLVLIEAVGTMGGQNNAVQTQGSLLRSLGALETVVECLNFKLEAVQPQKWKRHFGLVGTSSFFSPKGNAKASALEVARRLYPDLPELARAKDHNRAEALLIAHYGHKVLA